MGKTEKHVFLDSDLNEKINIECQNLDITFGQFLRKVLKEHFAENANCPEKKTEEKKPYSYFAPPSLAEMTAYFLERHSTEEEAVKCFDFYTSKNWFVGKTKMKDWKAAVRNWLRVDNPYKKERWKTTTNPDDYRKYTNEKGEVVL